MSNPPKNEYCPDYVSAPGETLREMLEERGVSQAELALRTGRPKKTISEIVNGKAAITPETALQFELVLGVPAEFWSARERHYREYLARLAEARALEQQAKWAQKFPVREMRRRRWLRGDDSPAGVVRELLQFYGVASPGQWESVAERQRACFRKPAAFRSDPYALSAWLRQGVRVGQAVTCAPFHKRRFTESLSRARELTRERPEVFCGELVKLCAEAGVAVAFVPELPKSRASGATRWLSPRKALIQLSFRYRSDDQLWFTFFHEAGHIILHGKKAIYIEAMKQGGPHEEAADRFAADFLIPGNQYKKLRANSMFTRDLVAGFARKIGVAPGIVVGRLQYDGLLAHNRLNGLKRYFAWSPSETSHCTAEVCPRGPGS
ncbi:MAG: helix-turn-helix domain-containing protein [Candidatus Eisenbacteria bacterium]